MSFNNLIMIRWILVSLTKSKQFSVDEITVLVQNNDFHENAKLIDERIIDILHQKVRKIDVASKYKALFSFRNEQMKASIVESYKCE